MIGQATGGSTLLEVIMLIVQVATPAAVMLVAWMGKRIIAQNDEKLRLMNSRIRELENDTRVTDKTSGLADERIRTDLAEKYISKTDHLGCRSERREDSLRIFEKIEALKTTMAGVTGEMKGMRTAVEGLAQGIGGLLRKE